MVAPTSRIGVERLDADVAVLELEGEHDLNTASQLRQQLDELLEQGHSIVVDLSTATFVDSSVLAALLRARQRAEEEGQRFAVAVPEAAGEGVRRVIEVTGLATVMPVRGTREEALRAVRLEDAR